MTSRKPLILHIQRHPTCFFSVERMYNSIRLSLSSNLNTKLFILPLPSSGFIAPVINALSCTFQKYDIAHVLGDITYVTLPIKRATIVTVISNSVKEDIINFVPCNSSKICVIPVPLTISIPPSPYAFNHDKPNVLIIGTTENKNLERSLIALSNFKCEVNIIGYLSDDQLNLMRELRITYQNFYRLTDSQVLECYIASDLLLFASTYEGFGMPIIEANAIGRPVITSNVSSMPEVAGDAALLVDPLSSYSIADGLRKVINSSLCRERLIANGFKNVKRFSPKNIAQQYASIYKQMLSQ